MNTKLYLMNKYGKTHFKGFEILSYILENYTYPINNFMKLYSELEKKLGIKKIRIERDIRYYREEVGFKNIPNAEFISNLLIEKESEEKSVDL